MIKAIETTYAGCRFRSRLEARWAVLFDYLEIPWEYEPQGMEVTRRLECSDETFKYLPDFWLPKHKVWVEVKGFLTNEECKRLLNAAASLSSNDGCGCHDSGGYDLVVCGPIPDPARTTGTPTRLHMHKGDLIIACGFCGDPHSARNQPTGPHSPYVIADDTGGIAAWATDFLLKGFPCTRHVARGEAVPRQHAEALIRARSARFEHGESGGQSPRGSLWGYRPRGDDGIRSSI